MLNVIPLLLAKAGAVTVTTKVAVAGAVSAAAIGTAGATGIVPVAELLPSDGTSVTIEDERSGADVLEEATERDGTAAGDGFDRAGEVAADEAQAALEAAQRAAADEAEAAQQAAADKAEAAQQAAEGKAEAAQQAAEGKAARTHKTAEAAPEQPEPQSRPSSGDDAADLPQVERGAGEAAGPGRG